MTQDEAKKLIEALKIVKDTNFTLDKINFYVKNIELETTEKNYKDISLLLDLGMSKKQHKRTTIQLRANKSTHLLRNEFFNTHTNPPYNKDKAPTDKILSQLMQKYSQARLSLEGHLHIYIDGYDDKWAFPISEFGFSDCDDKFMEQIEQFCKYANIKIKLQRVLF
ncbi:MULTISPECIES: DUF6978 family protein [unclassified Campylobacter]|uniref:DUF6978 family protein n=1 Tax=unclassified Campylobacter TaxID=2593542 RepID=UPI003D34092C